MDRLRVLPIETGDYRPHALHGEGVAWVEKNCYVDVWIETLHAAGAEPLAMLPFVLRVDFEGDQWTFFKPPHEDLAALYGVEVEELNCWRGLLEHARSHLAQGNLLFTESDAFHLPDTQATDYRRNHTKTTLVINDLDLARRRLGYFHNAGYYALEGEDFARTFRLDTPHDPAFMPFYAEFVKLGRLQRRPARELLALSAGLLRKHLARRPAANPVRRFAERFPQDLEVLKAGPIETYHGYAFALIRQLGAAFELAAQHLAWRGALGETGLAPAQHHCLEISAGCKALILKAARVVHARRDADFTPLLGDLAHHWDSAMALLDQRFAEA